MYYKPPKNLKVRAYVKNYDEIIKDRDLEIIILQQRIDKAIEYINSKLESLKMNKEAIMRILEPSNGYLLADVNYKIQKWERLLSILGGNNE